MAKQKWMYIIAGANGAGKSSVATPLIAQQKIPTLTKLNADEVNAQLRVLYPHLPSNVLNLRAAKLIDGLVDDCISLGHSFTVETVLSTDKYRQRVIDAKAAGFKIGLIYVSLWPPELSPDRIAIRVGKGGHNVEHDTAIKRYHKSHAQLTWFAEQADRLFVLDNSAGNQQALLIASKHPTKPLALKVPNLNPAVDKALAPLLAPKKPSPVPAKAQKNKDPS
jgi:predicted ABC-type ATPase